MDEFQPNADMFSNLYADTFLNEYGGYDEDLTYLDSFSIPSSYGNPLSVMMPTMIEEGYSMHRQNTYPIPDFDQHQHQHQRQQQQQQQQLGSFALEKTQSTQSSTSTDSMFSSSTNEDMQWNHDLTMNPGSSLSSLSSPPPRRHEDFPMVPGHELLSETPHLILCQCGTRFKGDKPKNVRSNYKRHCKSIEARFVCRVCSKAFNRLDNYRQHLKIH